MLNASSVFSILFDAVVAADDDQDHYFDVWQFFWEKLTDEFHALIFKKGHIHNKIRRWMVIIKGDWLRINQTWNKTIPYVCGFPHSSWKWRKKVGVFLSLRYSFVSNVLVSMSKLLFNYAICDLFLSIVLSMWLLLAFGKRDSRTKLMNNWTREKKLNRSKKKQERGWEINEIRSEPFVLFLIWLPDFSSIDLDSFSPLCLIFSFIYDC